MIKLLLILLEIGFGIKFNIIGTISLSELALIGTSLLYIKKDLYIRYPILKTITWLYVGLLLSQILSEVVIGNAISNSLRGYAVTIVSYLHFIFLFRYFVKDRKIIIYAIIGMIAKSLIFGSEVNSELSQVVEGEGAVFLKFYLAPFIINLILLISVFSRKKLTIYLCLFFGIAFIVLGARSSGLSVFLTGLICYSIILFKRKIDKKKLIFINIVVAIIGYGLYVVYVNNVLNGTIKAGNSWQLKEVENPYNPINLLVMGRSEALVGWAAFMDNPFFGHGAWALDETGKYQTLMFKFTNSDPKDFGVGLIPAHSVLIGSGMQNGIFAFVFMASILFLFIKNGINSINKKDPYLIIIVSFIISIIWIGMFSPTSHFRIDLPLFFAFLLATKVLYQRKLKYEKFKRINILKKQMNENLLCNNR